MKGYVNSFQSLGAVDGPGVRVTVFLQGCGLRCAYCHNPDTWKFGEGQVVETREIFDKIVRFKPFFKERGGVTLSGGEPLRQPDFVAELFELLKKQNIHTALDTAGMCDIESAKKVLAFTDLVICDIKFCDDENYKKWTGGSLKTVLEFLDLCEKTGTKLWVRHVVVPSITDSKEEVEKVIESAERFSVLEKIELLPFRKICQSKYDSLGVEFPLKDVPECSAKKIEELKMLIPEKFR